MHEGRLWQPLSKRCTQSRDLRVKIGRPAWAAPNLDDMKVFSTVVEVGGFRPAAQRLGVPASTVSDIVRRLEESLGLRLLNRSTRGVMPTEAGRRLLSGLK